MIFILSDGERLTGAGTRAADVEEREAEWLVEICDGFAP
jgi:hypothetical protein